MFSSLRRLEPAAAWLAFLAVCLGPYLVRLRAPSLYADDIVRVSQLQTGTLREVVLAPFNEHIAPLFQVVSWLSWRLAGRQLAWAPTAFTLASFLPFLPTLGLLAWVVRRESRSKTAALACVAVFSLSWLAIETVYWYSASSFLWALLATLAAWLGASETGANRGKAGWVVAAVASGTAPAFSAVGMLAGPVAAVRALAAPGGRRLAALAPLSGTLAALLLYAALHDRAALASNVGRSAGVGAGLLTAARAPAAALVPALAGLRTWSATTGPMVACQVALTAAAAVALLFRTYRGHDRPLTLGGLALIAGGYVLTFCARAGEADRALLLETQRYHLFPMLGLVLLLAPAFRLALARLDARPAAGVWAATALAVVLLVLHGPEMKGRARFLRYPDQARTFAAIDRFGSACMHAGITRAQALAALDPIEAAWAPAGYNALILLGPGASTAAVPDALVKPTLLSALTPGDRRSLCGGMDATPYLRPDVGDSPALAVGRRVALVRARASDGRPSYIEYELSGPETSEARALALTGPDAVEVWWRGAGQRWSEARSVKLRPRTGGAWLLPLEQLPHWGLSDGRRVRMLYRAPGPIALTEPRLVR